MASIPRQIPSNRSLGAPRSVVGPYHLSHRLHRRQEPERSRIIVVILNQVEADGARRRYCTQMAQKCTFYLTCSAHFIRNADSQMARAVCALDSVSRWAVTGTPIQNHINDLAALLKFLHVYPYSEKRVFDADISHHWKSGNDGEAVKRLKRLAGCLLLRRSKGTVQLPPRHDQVCHIEFLPQERELYSQVRTQLIDRLDESILAGSQGIGTATSFVSILQQIEAMRMVCNLGLLYPSRHNMLNKAGKARGSEDWTDIAQGAFNLRLEMGPVQCHYCSFSFDASYDLLADAESVKPLFAQCLRCICSGCATLRTSGVGCGHKPPCPIVPVSTNASTLEESPVFLSQSALQESAYLPTKVRALIEDLQRQPLGTKW